MSDFTPTEELMLEVLIARRRLGEGLWTFSRNPASIKAAEALAKRGYIQKIPGMVERTFRAALTDEGFAEFMDRDYRAPILNEIRTLVDGTEWLPSSWRNNLDNLSRMLAPTSVSSSKGDES